MRRRLGCIACTLGVAMLILMGLLMAVHVVGTDAKLYHKLQMKAEILDYAGISEGDLIRLDEALADCLSGNADALANLTVDVFGQPQLAFNERERIHMDDCRKLFDLVRIGIACTLVAGGLLVVAGFTLVHERRWFCRAVWLGPLVILVPLGIFALWAVLDFNAAFNFFHELLFTNDLWLLSPRTDLLIRICPQSMFQNMGLRIGLMALIWMGGAPWAIAALKKEKV